MINLEAKSNLMSTPQISRPLNLSYLYEVSDDDREFVKDMIKTIIKNTPGGVAEILDALEKNNWTEVSRLIHKLKPSLLLLNIESISNHVKSVENKAKKQINLDQAAIELREMEEYCHAIVEELKETLLNDSY